MVDLAVAVPSVRSIVAGLAVVIGIAQLPATHRSGAHRVRLTLEAPPPEHQGTLYISAFSDGGDVTITTDYDDLVPLRIETRAYLNDGCRWLGTETLTPMDATHYAYAYDEDILSCEPGAPYIETMKTPRQGVVTVEPYDGYSTRFMMWKP
jgi:hypothetical protein